MTEQERIDRLYAAIHEAGHVLVAAMHDGIRSRA